MQMSRLKLSYGKRLYFFHALTTLYLCFIYTLSMLYLCFIYTLSPRRLEVGLIPCPSPEEKGGVQLKIRQLWNEWEKNYNMVYPGSDGKIKPTWPLAEVALLFFLKTLLCLMGAAAKAYPACA